VVLSFVHSSSAVCLILGDAQKNKADTMIIVYDDDEKIAAGVATLFVQKGWENVYLMSGGSWTACHAAARA